MKLGCSRSPRGSPSRSVPLPLPTVWGLVEQEREGWEREREYVRRRGEVEREEEGRRGGGG